MSLGVAGLLVLVFLSAFGMTRLLCSPASTLYFLDHPNQRSLHGAPVTRTGGLAIIGSVVLGLVGSLVLEWSGVSLWNGGSATPAESWRWILGAALLVVAVSFGDDRVGLSPGFRLGVHALAAVGVVGGAGLTVRTVPIPLLGTMTLGWLAVPFTILCLMWLTNLYNFMDGMDGLAGGMAVCGFGVLSAVAWIGGRHILAILALLIAGAAGGFLLCNMPPARIFMGDVGSVSLGFLAGVLALTGVHEALFDIWVPVLIFSPFIVDATVTLFRRLLRGEKVWQAHREHYYQRLVLAGWGHRKTMLAEYLLMVTCGGSAFLYLNADEPARLILLLAWLVVYASLAYAVSVIEGRAAEHQGGER